MRLVFFAFILVLASYAQGISYNLTKNGHVCMFVHTSGSLQMGKERYHLLPSNKVNGSCNPPFGNRSSIVLPVGTRPMRIIGNLVLNFTMNMKSKQVSLTNITLNLFKRTPNKVSFKALVKMGNSSQYFSCNSGISFKKPTVNLTLLAMKIQAFNVTGDSFSKKAFRCRGDLTTTAKPRTTTGKPRTTTVKPRPTTMNPNTPPIYYLKDKKGYCAMAQFTAKFTFSYKDTKSKKTQTPTIPVTPYSKEVQVKGSCGNQTNIMIITFSHKWSLTLNFTRKKSEYSLAKISLKYFVNNATFPNIRNKTGFYHANKSQTFYSTKCDGYYVCSSSKNFVLAAANPKITFNIANVKFQMFRNFTGLKFDGKKNECTTDTAKTVIPIVVGVVLCVLVIVVLVIYLVGRRRRQAAGYQSI